MPHRIINVASVWQSLNKCCNDRLYCLLFFAFKVSKSHFDVNLKIRTVY